MRRRRWGGGIMLADELRGMPLDQLWLLHEQVTKVLSNRLTVEKSGLEKRLAKLNSTTGTLLAESQETPERSRRKYPQVFPKYRNPLAPFETWSGRGKCPRWLATALQEGQKIEDFEIEKQDVAESEHEDSDSGELLAERKSGQT